MASLPPIDVPKARRPARGIFDAPAAGEKHPAHPTICCASATMRWCLGSGWASGAGTAPVLEVDISLANLALDMVGQATLLLTKRAMRDRLAFHRDVLDFRNCLLVEQPNGDFAQTIARHLLYTTWQHLLLQRLTRSSDRFLSEFAHKAVKEVAYHRELAREWTIRLGDGTEESARRMAEGLDWCWRFVPELFEVDETLQAAIDGGIAPDPREFEAEYRSAIAAILAEAKLEAPADQRPILGGRRGHHSEHLGHLLAVMQFLPRTYPDATW